MRYTTAALVLLAPGVAVAQSNIDPAHKYAWSENLGWSNWADAGSPAGSQGVRVESNHLKGFIWFENGGWVNTGNGPATPGGTYSNATGADAGVNIAPGGELSGFAWGENIGWINFNTSTLGADRARIDFTAGRFRGWAWGENIGWVNLNHGTHYVGVLGGGCYANCDGSTQPPILNVQDFSCFLSRYAAGDPYANCDGSTQPPVLNVQDFSCFLSKYAAGCP